MWFCWLVDVGGYFISCPLIPDFVRFGFGKPSFARFIFETSRYSVCESAKMKFLWPWLHHQPSSSPSVFLWLLYHSPIIIFFAGVFAVPTFWGIVGRMFGLSSWSDIVDSESICFGLW